MIEVVALGGEPASGKSRVAYGVIKRALTEGQRMDAREGWLDYLIFPRSRLIVLGVYPQLGPEHFPGTDRLSMSIQPHALRWLKHQAEKQTIHGYRVFFEGDRLFNSRFLSDIRAAEIPLRAAMLQASAAALTQRHEARGDTQRSAFLKGRRTKLENIRAEFLLPVLRHETEDDTLRVVEWVFEQGR